MKCITVAAAVICNAENQLLLVRKRNTAFFMQVGGKLEPNEAPEATLLREIAEEIGVQGQIQQFIGRFETPAANEADHLLISYVYLVKIDQAPQIQAEIAEMRWIDLGIEEQTWLAPLTTEVVLPWCRAHVAKAVVV
ncbi:8-oxo-dGTP diphosphatase [Acinetobacter calcoaceticus]|uniref:8-oxo-dGTP diphosphatase n=1 Tax=Acinetobacter calcoaceticus TaxID=471 RepID=A0A4R1Y172_ACICA|nr:8-oxo-dGTP diphosphatase [Acinetobacter calcoaceticus]